MASLFSQRAGLKPAKKAIQLASIDKETRNGLWSELDLLYDSYHRSETGHGHPYFPYIAQFNRLMKLFWTDYFKEASDTFPDVSEAWKKIRQTFFTAPWNEVLDILDFTAQHMKTDWVAVFLKECNRVFEKESCAYRFVGGQVTEITGEVELETIDSAIESAPNDVAEHLLKALRFFSDRVTPDYHNSIKESVSAIEASARRVAGQRSAVLSDAIKKLNETSPIHPALMKMILGLYGYAGDEGGVRHANKENALPVTSAEARLILVMSSALCGFLAAKSPELKS